MKKLSSFFTAILAFSLVFVMLFTFSSCKRNDGPTSLSIDGEENVAILLGETVRFSITTDGENSDFTWSVVDENLDGDYIFNGSSFTAKNTSGYAVIEVSSQNGLSDRVTIVINRPVAEQGKKVIFYSMDGVSVIDIRYTDENGKVIPPAYSAGGDDISWLDKYGNQVDFSDLVITEDCSFTAYAHSNVAYCTITYWYYGVNGEPNFVAEFTIDYANGESISTETLHNIESEIETKTEMSIANWICEISDDGTSIDWYAELK